MIRVFRDSGFPVQVRAKDGVIEVELGTSLGADGGRQFEERERVAAIAAVRNFLHPQSVAVIGASRRRVTIGAEILANIIQGDFAGSIYPVNPQADAIQGLRPTPPSVTFPRGSTWRSWRCPRPRSIRWPANAAKPAYVRCS